MEQGSKNCFPVKRVVAASVLTLIGIFFGTFILALLVNYSLISIKSASLAVFAVVFLAGFAGSFLVKASNRRILYTILSSVITFCLLNLLGLLMPYKFIGENTIYVLIILVFSAIINSVVCAII